MASSWLGQLIQAEKQLNAANPEAEWAERAMGALAQIHEDQGMPFDPQALRDEAMAFDPQAMAGDPELAAADRRLAEEIAAMRCGLRSLFALALETEADGVYIHQVELYGRQCLRLVRLLKVEGRQQDRLAAYLRYLFDRALREVQEEMGLVGEAREPDC
jgi:hypothetical protein